MFGFIKRMLIALLTSLVDAFSHRNGVPLSDQKCEIQQTLINLNPNEYSQELHYYPLRLI